MFILHAAVTMCGSRCLQVLWSTLLTIRDGLVVSVVPVFGVEHYNFIMIVLWPRESRDYLAWVGIL